MPVTGTVTFKTNTVPLGPPVPLTNGVAALATTGLAHGLTTIWAEYPGEGLFLGSTGSVVQLVNAPPVPGYHVAYVMENEPLVLPVATLLANDNDPDGDPLNIIKVSALSPRTDAIDFEGRWDKPFDAKATSPAPFRLSPDDVAYAAAFDTVHLCAGGFLEEDLQAVAAVARVSFDFKLRRDPAYLDPLLSGTTFAFFSASDLDDEATVTLLERATRAGDFTAASRSEIIGERASCREQSGNLG